MAVAAVPLAMMVGSMILSKMMEPDPPQMPSYAPPPQAPVLPTEDEIRSERDAMDIEDAEISKNRSIRRRKLAQARVTPNIYGLGEDETANSAATGS